MSDPETTVEAASRRVTQARDALRSHLEGLGRRVEAHITAHPLRAVGIAAGFGAILAIARTRRPRPEDVRTVRGMLSAAAGALALRILRDVALGRASSAAQQWWAERDGGSDEPFLEH